MSSISSSHKRKSGAQRTFWRRDYFYDHPGYDSNRVANSTAESKMPGGKAKVYCVACFDHHVAYLKEQDVGLPNARTEQQIKDYLWTLSRREQSPIGRDNKLVFGYMAADLQTMVHHLTKCENVSAAVNQLAEDYEDQHPPKRRKRDDEREQHYNQLQAASLQGPTAGPSNPYFANAPTGSFIQLDSPPFTGPPPSVMSSSSIAGTSPSGPGYPRALSHTAPLPRTQTVPASIPIDPNLIPPDSPPASFTGNFANESGSFSSASTSASHHPSLHAWPLSAHPSMAAYITNKFAAVRWTQADQHRFERLLAELTASAGFALSWTGNPAWIALLAEFLPLALNPSRYFLTHSLIPAAVADMRQEAQRRAHGNMCTLQEDGWTGINSHYIIAYMIAIGREVHTVRVYDETGQSRDAEHLADLTIKTIDQVTAEWGVQVTSFASDAGGEARKGRKIVVRRRPEIFAPDCYAHQLQLVVGDFVDKSDSNLREISDKADDLIAWVRGKSFVIFLLKQAQESAGQGAALTVVRAAMTRWTSHHLAYHRLLEVHPALKKVVEDDRFHIASGQPSQIIKGDKNSKAKARAMMETVNDDAFWRDLLKLKRMLEPLAKAANIAQADICRPDQVLLIFGSLIYQYNRMRDVDVDIAGRCAILASLEKRWEKCEQEVYIATTFVNPFVRMDPFKRKYNTAQLFDLFSKLYKRFFKESEDPEGLYDDIFDYSNRRGQYALLEPLAVQVKLSALKKKESPNPLKLWDALVVPDGPNRPLVKLARLLLSICCNSASCERLFSVFGTILTKSRAQLGTKTLEALAELRLYIRDREKRDQSARERLKEHYAAQRNRARAQALQSEAATQTVSPHAPRGGGTANSPPSTRSISPSPPPTFSPAPSAPSGPRDRAQASTVPGRFATVMDDCMRAVEDDEDLDQPSSWPGAAQVIPLEELFDFGDAQRPCKWVELMDLETHHSLEEEMAIYELLDFDAPGNIDDDSGGHELDADAMAEAIFS